MNKILLLIPSLKLGGAEKNIIWLGESLNKKNFEVKLLYYIKDEVQLQPNINFETFECNNSGSKLSLLTSRVKSLMKIFKKNEHFYIIAFLESISIPTIIASILTRQNKSVIVSVRGNPEKFTLFYKILAFIFFRFAKKITIPSESAANYLRKKFSLKNVIAIPNVAPSSNFEIIKNENKNGIIAVGRLVRGKRFDLIVEIVSMLSIKNIELTIIGSGPEKKNLELIAKEKNVRISFLTEFEHKNVLERISKSKLLISCSETECWPNVLIEAMSVGTVVASNDCKFGPSEIITDGENGILFNNNDVADAVIKIKSVLENTPLYIQLQNQSIKSISKFNNEEIVKKWLQIL